MSIEEDPIITDKDGAKMLGMSLATYWRRVKDGTIPPPMKLGGMARWKKSDIEGVIEKADRDRWLSASDG